MSYDFDPTLIDIAAQRIGPQLVRTPLVRSIALSDETGAEVHLKLEHLQTTGSFKLRGATNAMMALTPAQMQAGVTCVSTGNHGRGLAYAARQNGVRAVICMGSLVPRNKVEGIQALGAEVRIVGDSQDEAQVEVDRLVAEEGMTLVPPFDHPDVIAGQGTVGQEILDDLPDADTVIAPLSGGGLLAGIACAVKHRRPETRVIGVTMEDGAAMHLSLQAGHLVDVDERPTLADALGGGIGPENHYTFPMIRELVDETLLVSETAIADAVRHAYFREQLVIEGSAAVGIAALLGGLVKDPGRCAVVLSGRNIDMDRHRRIVEGIEPY